MPATQPKKYLVADYMRTKVVTVKETNTLEKAIGIMLKEETNGLVVTDEQNIIKGILSVWDIIHYIVPDYLEEDTHLASFESEDLFAQRIQELKDHLIKDFMTPKVHVVHPESSLMEAATLLAEFRIRQLPVVDKEGKLVGHLSRTTIKQAIGNVLGI
jgi:CBS domain-containing protein